MYPDNEAVLNLSARNRRVLLLDPRLNFCTDAHQQTFDYRYDPLAEMLSHEFIVVRLRRFHVRRPRIRPRTNSGAVKPRHSTAETGLPIAARAAILVGHLVARCGIIRCGYAIARRQYIVMFRRHGASVIVADQPSAPMCQAARTVGAVVLDYQHGFISVSQGYYSALSRRVARQALDLIPHGILCLDEASVRTVAVALKPISPVPTGFLVLASDRGTKAILHGVEAVNDCISLRVGEADRIIAVFDQWTPSEEDAAARREFFAHIRSAALSNPTSVWIVRQHPLGKIGADIKTLVQDVKNIVVDDFFGKVCAFSLLTVADVAVTRSSAIVHEAIAVRIPTIVFDARFAQECLPDGAGKQWFSADLEAPHGEFYLRLEDALSRFEPHSGFANGTASTVASIDEFKDLLADLAGV